MSDKVKVASTHDIITLLQKHEKEHGIGAVKSIGVVCAGSRNVEYIFHICDQKEIKTRIGIPSVYTKNLWDTER